MIVTGDTRPLKELLQRLGGGWNRGANRGGALFAEGAPAGGWVFTGSQKDALLAALRAEPTVELRVAEGVETVKLPPGLTV